MLLQALKSKTMWAGLAVAVWGGAVLPFLNAGVFTRESIVSLVTGVGMIVLRAITTGPISSK